MHKETREDAITTINLERVAIKSGQETDNMAK